MKEGERNQPEEQTAERQPEKLQYYAKDSITMGPRVFAEPGEINERSLDGYEKELGLDIKELSGKDVLNLGAGATLAFEKSLQEGGIDARVVSLSPDYSNTDHRKRALEDKPEVSQIASGVGQQLPFKNESFDYVLALHVTEHLKTKEAYEAMLREIVRVLRVNGKGYIAPVHDQYFPEVNPNVIPDVQFVREKGLGFIKIYPFSPSDRPYRLPLERIIVTKTIPRK